MVLRVDHDVRRFQIAMDDAGLVRGGEAGGDLAGEQQDARQRQPRLALQQGRQVGALHVLHGEVQRAVDVAQVVDRTTLGWVTWRASFSSRLKRSSSCLSSARGVVASTRMSLSATAVPSVSSQAW